MRTQFPLGLRLVFALAALGMIFFAASAMIAPKWVADLSGLPGVDLPAIQQAGALALGYAVALFLAIRASTWQEMRIPVIFSLTNFVFSALGAFYYVVLKGFVTPYLVLILVFSICLAGALGYYLWMYTKQQGGIRL